MAGVHGLEKIHCFFTAHLAQHNSIRTHAQSIYDQLPLQDFTSPFDVGRTAFQPDHMFLLQLQLG
jgi:hypothetical protein